MSLDFSSEIFDNYTWEYWTSSDSSAYVDGVSKLLNLTFDAVDINEVYYEILDTTVQASGAAPPKTATPVPYGTPKGFSKDIDNWLAPSKNSEAGISKTLMFDNIDIAGAAPGTVIAAQSYSNPDYAYNWVRDSSLTMDVVNSLYSAASIPSVRSKYEKILFQYAGARAAEQVDPGLQTSLGEPKFYLNNSIFTGPWGRPQNDGAATSALTLVS